MCEVFRCVTTHIVFQFRFYFMTFSLRCLAQLVAIVWLGDDCSVGEGPPSSQHFVGCRVHPVVLHSGDRAASWTCHDHAIDPTDAWLTVLAPTAPCQLDDDVANLSSSSLLLLDCGMVPSNSRSMSSSELKIIRENLDGVPGLWVSSLATTFTN